jgi:hypothetical protein
MGIIQQSEFADRGSSVAEQRGVIVTKVEGSIPSPYSIMEHKSGYVIKVVSVLGRSVTLGLDADLLALMNNEQRDRAWKEAHDQAFIQIRESYGLGK